MEKKVNVIGKEILNDISLLIKEDDLFHLSNLNPNILFYLIQVNPQLGLIPSLWESSLSLEKKRELFSILFNKNPR